MHVGPGLRILLLAISGSFLHLRGHQAEPLSSHQKCGICSLINIIYSGSRDFKLYEYTNKYSKLILKATT